MQSKLLSGEHTSILAMFMTCPEAHKKSVIAQLSPQECLLPVIKNKRNEYPSKSVVEEMLKLHNISKTETEFTESSVTTDLNRLLELGEEQTFHNAHTEAYGMKVAHHSMGAILKYLEVSILIYETSFFYCYGVGGVDRLREPVEETTTDASADCQKGSVDRGKFHVRLNRQREREFFD
ncbi:hypothetical protein TNCV_3550801 [Trichonephila clavipes]|nr:hypothetical protein TNCV_3550801 [Trichonephila clavipes]